VEDLGDVKDVETDDKQDGKENVEDEEDDDDEEIDDDKEKRECNRWVDISLLIYQEQRGQCDHTPRIMVS
jgi:hypothetical protein